MSLRLPSRTWPAERREPASAPGWETPPRPVPWSVLCDAAAVQLVAPTRRAVRRVPVGTQVAIAYDGPLARLRLRQLARRGRLTIERELVVVPTTAQPIAVLDDDETAVRHFWQAVVAVPPGLARSALVATLTLRAAQALPWRWTGALAPGRVLIGRRR